MRWLAVALIATGCGRLQFDPNDDVCFRTLERTGAPYAGMIDGAHLICTAEQLDAIGRHPEHWSDAFALGADLDLAELPGEVTRIGEASRPFSGLIDGRGHTLANLTFDRPTENHVGLLRFTTAAQVRNLELRDVAIDGQGIVGALVGLGAGALVLEDIKLSGRVSGGGDVGGLVGINECFQADGCSLGVQIRSVRVEAIELTATGSNAGGIIGYTYSETGRAARISDVYVAGSIRGSSGVGGVVGDAELVTLERATTTATITAVSSAGGLFGATVYAGTSILDSSTSGDVTCDSECGGAAGFHEGSAIRTQAHGDITCTGSACGGLFGAFTYDCDQCIATGNVRGANYTGGLVGDAYLNGHAIRNSYATGDVTGIDYVGGVTGRLAGGELHNSYATGMVSGNAVVGGLIGELEFLVEMPVVATSFSATSVMAMTPNDTVSSTIGRVTGIASINAPTLAHAGTCSNTSGSCIEYSNPVAPASLYGPSAATASWDFATVWEQHPDRYPTLREVPLP